MTFYGNVRIFGLKVSLLKVIVGLGLYHLWYWAWP